MYLFSLLLLLHSIIGQNNAKYEIYVIEEDNAAFKEYFNQLQTFVLWYIDASNFIDCDDSKWKIFIV